MNNRPADAAKKARHRNIERGISKGIPVYVVVEPGEDRAAACARKGAAPDAGNMVVIRR